MPLQANKVPSAGGFRQPTLEPGPYPGRVVKVIDLGLQPQSYLGQDKEPAYKISVTYELLDEFMVDEDGNVQSDKPRWISEEMPIFSLGAERAKSTARYLALDPQRLHDGDWTALLGKPCVVTIVNNPGKGRNEGRVYNNVGNVSPMRAKDAESAPELVNEAAFFDLGSPDVELFNAQPDFIKEKITSNLEYRGSALEKILNGGTTPDVADNDTDYMDEDAEPAPFE